MNTSLHRLALSAALVALLGGCASSVKLDEAPIESRNLGGAAGVNAGAGAGGGAAAKPVPESKVATVSVGQAALAAALASGRVVYFDYDSFSLREDARSVVEAHAKALSTNRSRKISVEGHTDERGGREYNLALGQKRAETVARAMALLGAGEGQVEAVSFGKERPAVQGQDEAAWAKNRRAELKDRP